MADELRPSCHYAQALAVAAFLMSYQELSVQSHQNHAEMNEVPVRDASV